MQNKKVILTFLILLAACSKESVRTSKDVLAILPAQSNLSSNTNQFISSFKGQNGSRDSKFDLNNFPSSGLSEVRLTINGEVRSAYGILSVRDTQVALLVNFDSQGSVISASFTENIVGLNGEMETKIFDLDGNLRVDFITSGKIITFKEVPIFPNGKVAASWWSDTGDCVSTVAQPFKNGVLNVIFDVAASAVTEGWYPVILVAACAIRSAV